MHDGDYSDRLPLPVRGHRDLQWPRPAQAVPRCPGRPGPAKLTLGKPLPDLKLEFFCVGAASHQARPRLAGALTGLPERGQAGQLKLKSAAPGARPPRRLSEWQAAAPTVRLPVLDH